MNAIALSISNTLIRQDNEGRFCLNDLHKASGGEKKHGPSYWMENQQTIDLIALLKSEKRENTVTGIPVTEEYQPVNVIQGGNNQGTFAVWELVYDYAKWISANFNLKVIRAYHALVTGPQYALKQLPEPPAPDLPAVLTLNGIAVRQDDQGRFCLNDFHKASGGEKRHQPSEWLDTRAARALVNSASKPGFAAAVSKPGHSTHAVKKAALAYAQWVGPEFGAEAARAFGELAKAAKARHGLRQLPEPPLITVAQQGELASLIGRKARNSGKNRVFFLRAVYDQFDLNAYRNVPAGKFDEVMEFLDRLEGDADPLYVFSKPELAALVERKIEEAKAGWTLDRTVSGLRFLLRFEEGGRVAAMAVSPDARVFSPAEYERTLHADGYAIVLQSAVDAIRQIANVNLVA